MNTLYRITQSFFRCLLASLYNLEFHGSKNMPHEGGFLVASNHESFFDPPAIGGGVEREISFFARKSLFKGVMEWYLPRVNTIPVERGASDIKAMKRVFEILAKGEGILVFPEGTRTPDGELQEVKKGIGMLACKSQSPVLPVRVCGFHKAYGKGSKLPKSSGEMTIMYGPLLYPKDYDPGGKGKERNQYASDCIMNSIAKLCPPKLNMV